MYVGVLNINKYITHYSTKIYFFFISDFEFAFMNALVICKICIFVLELPQLSTLNSLCVCSPSLDISCWNSICFPLAKYFRFFTKYSTLWHFWSFSRRTKSKVICV